MSGAFTMPHALTGGAGYKANPTYDEFLRKHSGAYRRLSAASAEQEKDRRASQMNDENAAAAAAATANVEQGRRGSVQNMVGGAAASNKIQGPVAVGSENTRNDAVFGMEATAGTNMDPNRRPSTSLASDLFHKIKGDNK